MNVVFRIWVLLVCVAAAVVTGFGMQPAFGGIWWPVAGLWVAACLAPFGLSVWAAMCLIMLGAVMDFMTEAPIGAWPLALVSAYGVALVAWDRQPPVPVWGAEMVSVIGGMIAAGLALGVAGAVSGHAGFSRAGFIWDFLLTAALYPLARFVLIPGDILRGGRARVTVRR